MVEDLFTPLLLYFSVHTARAKRVPKPSPHAAAQRLRFCGSKGVSPRQIVESLIQRRTPPRRTPCKFPPPLLWLDADLQPEQVSGADLVVLVEPARRPGEPLRVRVIGREVNRLFTLLRAAADADAWQ